jgi:7-carboxy-7-deazaguanine synthase
MMRLSELYPSVQGEGPRVGVPTLFVRFGGCNLRCPGWPCDTPHAIFPETYRHEWEKLSPEGLVERITILAARKGISNICLTGGEPFLQPKDDMHKLIAELDDAGYQIEAFSTGTLPYGAQAVRKVNFVVDWKLPGSGEHDVGHTERLKNLERLSSEDKGDAVKFVIKDWADFVAAKQAWEDFVQHLRGITTFYGVAWGHLENSDLINWVLDAGLPWRLNVQVHNHIWDRSQRAI